MLAAHLAAVRGAFAALCLVIAFQVALIGTASARAVNDLEIRVGVFGSFTNNDAYAAAPQAVQPHPENTVSVYDPAMGVRVYVNQNPWTFYDPLGLGRYKGSNFSDEEWEQLSDGAKKYIGSRDHEFDVLDKAGFDTGGGDDNPIEMTQRKITLTTAGEVTLFVYTQGDKTLYLTEYAGGKAFVAWDDLQEAVGDLNWAAFMRGKGGDAIIGLTATAGGFSTPGPIDEVGGLLTRPKVLPKTEIAPRAIPVPKELPKTLSPRQSLHNPASLAPGRSPLTANAQELLDGIHAGRHPIVRMNPRGQPVVDFGREIGTHAGTGKATRFGTVHYGQKGAHIVPANPIQF